MIAAGGIRTRTWRQRVALIGLLILIQSVLVGAPPASASSVTSIRNGAWSSPRTWNLGRVPEALDIVEVRHEVQLDRDAIVAGMTIRPRGSLAYLPSASRTLTSTGNVIVYGTLQMRPSSAARVHRLAFAGIDEQAFVGGGHEPLPTDVGLWVRPGGRLKALGAPKTSWTRATASIPAGASSFSVDSAQGWRAGDEIVLGPTRPEEGREAFEVRTISRVDASTGRVSLASGTARAHSDVRLPTGRVLRPEVLNLTRNVRIEGTPTGRSHTHFSGSGVQRIRYVALRYMGVPIDGDPDRGRYALHFHHSHNLTRGSLVEGVVARDVGTHAFVPHASHGITFSKTIAYNFESTAYWWDRLESDGSVVLTHDTTYRGCIAANGVSAGIAHLFGLRNAMVGCVAYGIDPTRTEPGRGFTWGGVPTNQEPFQGIHAVWKWRDGIAHNTTNPIRVWQNTGEEHNVVRPIAYWATPPGGRVTAALMHGAYLNVYHYSDGVLVGSPALDLHAASGLGRVDRSRRQVHSNMAYDADGGPYAITIGPHNIGGGSAGLIADCTIQGFTRAAVVIAENTSNEFSRGGDYTFRNCVTGDGSDLAPTDFEIVDLHRESEICIQNGDEAWTIAGQGSVFRVTPAVSCP